MTQSRAICDWACRGCSLPSACERRTYWRTPCYPQLLPAALQSAQHPAAVLQSPRHRAPAGAQLPAAVLQSPRHRAPAAVLQSPRHRAPEFRRRRMRRRRCRDSGLGAGVDSSPWTARSARTQQPAPLKRGSEARASRAPHLRLPAAVLQRPQLPAAVLQSPQIAAAALQSSLLPAAVQSSPAAAAALQSSMHARARVGVTRTDRVTTVGRKLIEASAATQGFQAGRAAQHAAARIQAAQVSTIAGARIA